MKKNTLLLTCVFTLSIVAVCYGAKGDPVRGKALFSDPKLSGSTNEQTCIQCHQKKGAFKSLSPEKKLEDTVNMCITNALAGKALEDDSQDMIDLKSYIHSQTK